MPNFQPLTGGSATRSSAAAAAPSRPGQVPSIERAPVRLVIFSTLVPLTPAGGPDREALLGTARRLGALGFGLALGLEPAERARLGWDALQASFRALGSAGASPRVVGASIEPASSADGILTQVEACAAQAQAIEEAGGVPLVLPLVALARRRAKEAEYVELYQRLLARVSGPVLLDWTGPAVRPELAGTFPGRSLERVLALEPTKVRGVRCELRDVVQEARLRRELAPHGQLLLTADRAHLAHLLLGAHPGAPTLHANPAQGHTEFAGRSVPLGDFSHALLSGCESEAETLAAALARLAEGDLEGYGAQLGLA